MLETLILGFLLGASVPVIARRFGKFIPTDPGETICRLIHIPRFPKGGSPKRAQLLRKTWGKLGLYAVVWGVILAALFAVVNLNFPVEQAPWLKAFIYILALLTAIDKRFFLLPDVLTVPLLILGFSFNIITQAISPTEAIIGTVYGYLVPTIAVLATYKFIQNGFGGGDVKMLAALGAWFGLQGVTAVLMISVALFALGWLIQRKRSDAYGPYLAIGALIVLFTRLY